jgi:hypothetical protein
MLFFNLSTRLIKQFDFEKKMTAEHKLANDFLAVSDEVKKLETEINAKCELQKSLKTQLISKFLLECKNTQEGVVMPDGKTPLVLTLKCCGMDDSDAKTSFDHPVHKIEKGKLCVEFDEKTRAHLSKVFYFFDNELEIACHWKLTPDKETINKKTNMIVEHNNFSEVAIKWYLKAS